MRPIELNASPLEGGADRWIRRGVVAVLVGVAAALTTVGALLYG